MSAADYFMDDPREADRLADKVEPADWVDEYLTPYLDDGPDGDGIQAGGAVLEVACGPAVLLRELRCRRPDLSCIGVDVSTDRLRHAGSRGEAPILIAGQATALPFRTARFDLVYCRMLLQYLPDPAAAVSELVRVARPGGRVLLQDLDGQLVSHFPPDPALDADLVEVLAALERTGFDPYVGRTLFGHAHAAGLTDLVVTAEAYHLIAGCVLPTERARWQLKFAIARPAIAAALGEARADAAIAGYLSYLDRPDSITFSYQFTVTGRSTSGTSRP